MNRVIIILTVLAFLLVVVPGPKLSFPVWALLVAPLLGVTGVKDTLIVVLPWVAVVYLVVSFILNINSRRDRLLQTICIAIFWAFLLFLSGSFLKHGNNTTLIWILPFFTLSIIWVYRYWFRPAKKA